MIEKIRLNGTELWLEHTGQGHPLLFIHGFSLDSRMWDDQFEAFKDDYQVIRYDLRGFGKSALPTESYRHSEDLLAILDYLNLDKVTLIGLSMGGGVALDFAISYPNRLASLVLVDSVLEGYTFSENWLSTNKLIWATGKKDIKDAKRLWLEYDLFQPALASAAAENLRQMITDYSGWHWQNKDPKQALSPKAMERLEQINIPTLIMVGDQDLPDFLAISEILMRISKSKNHTFPNVGHISNMESPQEFNQVLNQFLKNINVN